jgi:hypothetical protein
MRAARRLRTYFFLDKLSFIWYIGGMTTDQSNMTAIVKSAKRQALRVLPDTERHKCRFDIPSETSDSIYRISFDSAPGAGYWVCSCFGYRRGGQCKHLTAMGLFGRKHGRSLKWVKHFRLG